MDKEQEKQVKTIVAEMLRDYDNAAFKKHRTVATPVDSYSVVNRRYVTLNGDVANRPKSSVATVGQPYFANDTSIPMVFNNVDWVNGVGSVVALGRNS